MMNEIINGLLKLDNINSQKLIEINNKVIELEKIVKGK